MSPQLKRRLLTIEKAASTYDLSPRTIRRRIADGTLPAFRVGHQIRLDAEATERILLQPMNNAATALLQAGDVA